MATHFTEFWAWLEGSRAYYAGLSKIDCPYGRFDQRRQAWLDGWEDAPEGQG
jgi:ribosome modulation factor